MKPITVRLAHNLLHGCLILDGIRIRRLAELLTLSLTERKALIAYLGLDGIERIADTFELA
jgi:hypothetical protein